MALIKKASELNIPTSIKMMVYGQAGMGKSTLGLSTPKPLLLDFDNGVMRINRDHLEGVDIVQVENWQNALDIFKEDLSYYQSIVVDTIGKMMDYIITYCCGTRQPQIRDWGAINAQFQNFTRGLASLGKNIVYIAHRDTRKEGDNNVFIPALREKSYNAIVSELDLLGYVEMASEHGQQLRTITFDPTSRNDGKNTCGLPSEMTIPNIISDGKSTQPNDFIENMVIKPYLTMLKVKQDERKAFDALMDEIKEALSNIDGATAANEFATNIGRIKHIGNSLAITRELFKTRVEELSLTYDKEKKMYE